ARVRACGRLVADRNIPGHFCLAKDGPRPADRKAARSGPAGWRSRPEGIAARTSARMGARKANQALSFLRPRARRARRTLRPPTVALRARKPWRRLRTRLLGWKVRFLSKSSNQTKTAAGRAASDMAARLVEGRAQVKAGAGPKTPPGRTEPPDRHAQGGAGRANRPARRRSAA